jgi:hypothetical protein
MGLFRKGASQPSAAYGGDSPHPPGAQLHELDQYVISAMETANYPAVGTPPYEELLGRVLAELAVAAQESMPWGVVGAFCVAINFTTDADRQKPAFVDLMDRALLVLRDDGVAYPSVPPFALKRWTGIHGYDESGPAHWPSALETLAVPDVGEKFPGVDLADDEWRPMTRDGASEDARTIYAHRSADSRVVAVVDGIDLSDGVRKQWELGVDSDSYTSFLGSLGDRLVTSPFWAHDDLRPYFPCRSRSRDEMRAAAKAARD